MQDAFTKLDKRQTRKVLEEVNSLFDGASFDPETVTILAQPLPFYSGYKFLDIADFSVMPALHRGVIYKAGNAIVLDGTKEPLYALNENAPLKLDEDMVLAYVRFFFTHIRGKHGRFAVVETPEDLAWREEPVPASRKALSEILEPLQVTAAGKDGGFTLSARMLFKGGIFKTDIDVSPKGHIDLHGEELLMENLPVLDETLGQ